MTKFQFPTSIKSRPLYGKLEPRSGYAHLVIADEEGADAIIDLVKSAPNIAPTMQILYVTANDKNPNIEKLKALLPAQFYWGPSFDAAQPRIALTLEKSQMGTQVYLSGTEGLMGRAMLEATKAGIPHSAIQTEHRGSTARRVQCVHCKGVTENVSLDPFQCDHCGLNLFVRDHYSRRLAAFQGVCIDAEDPGNVPDPKELYS